MVDHGDAGNRQRKERAERRWKEEGDRRKIAALHANGEEEGGRRREMKAEGGHVPTRRNSIQSHETDNNNQVGSWEEGRGGGQTPAAHCTSVVKPSLSRGQSSSEAVDEVRLSDGK